MSSHKDKSNLSTQLKKATEKARLAAQEMKSQETEEHEALKEEYLKILHALLRKETIPEIKRLMLETAQIGKRECFFLTGSEYANGLDRCGSRAVSRLKNLIGYPSKQGEIIADEIVKVIKAEKSEEWQDIKISKKIKRERLAPNYYSTDPSYVDNFYVCLRWQTK